MILAIGSLGLPVGTQMHADAVAFAAAHPVRVWTDPLLFWAAVFTFMYFYGRYLDRKEAEKVEVVDRFTSQRFISQ